MLKSVIQELKTRLLWKRCNKHNYTRIGSNRGVRVYKLIKDCNLKVGKYTYGALNIDTSGDNEEGLSIGSYCSISNKCHFLLSGEHNVDRILTYPVEEYFFNETSPRKTKGKIIVEDDVWIGDQALVLSGVHIGQGAIIAAGAVVVKDVPPYAVVGGVPARIIKYRFSNCVINKLLESNIYKYDLKKIPKNMLTEILDETNVDELIRSIRNYCEKK